MPAAAPDPAPPNPSAAPAGLKLRRLEIENFKAIDKLVLDLPAPLMEDDPDVFVIGSKNGIGKTSILEAAALLWLAATFNGFVQAGAESSLYSFRQFFIRADTSSLRVAGTFHEITTHEVSTVAVQLPQFGPLSIAGLQPPPHPFDVDGAERFYFPRLFGAVAEPFLTAALVYLHCNRRITHGPVSLSENAAHVFPESFGFSLGYVKHELLRFILAQAGLFEDIRSSSTTQTAVVLAELFTEFAGSTLSKLRTRPDNTFDIRVQPLRGGGSFSFDALSSGQKEMISTLFLIWQHTRNQPSLVLIDEPELHLNAEWQTKFIRLLFKLAPWNQYILATHSEYVFRSVQEDRRLLIGPQG